ncbi:MAG TPA: tryptophan synthase subunit alpha [Kofleriaceae bacterium]|jgi:tryptophan synthase alpha chain|nr:tryptophan synthase subunit alpha [Kofleriaceae bacterium]
MSRLREAFEHRDRAALVAYLTFGDPAPSESIDVIEHACRSGADVLELGVAFSDPSADGPSIQRAMERALAAGATLAGALDAVAELRRRGVATPIVLFGYYNPIFVMGVERFAERAAQAGVDAVLTVDLPIDELGELAAPLAKHGVSVIPLVAPTSTPARIARLAEFLPPFVYYISLVGVTGASARGAIDPARLDAIRRAAAAPVAVGFGIRTADDVRRFVAAGADGVVVGTALVERVADGGVAQLVAQLAAGLGKS